MKKTLTQRIKEIAIVGTISVVSLGAVGRMVYDAVRDTNLDIGYAVRGNSVEFYDGGIMHPDHVVVTFADGTTTNLVGRENYFRFLNTANTNYSEFEKFLAQNPEHSRINPEQE